VNIQDIYTSLKCVVEAIEQQRPTANWTVHSKPTSRQFNLLHPQTEQRETTF